MNIAARRAVRAAGLFGLLVAVYFLVYSGWPVSGDEQVMFDGAHSFYRNGTLELGYFSNLRPTSLPPRVEDRPVLWLDVEPLQALPAAGLIWPGAAWVSGWHALTLNVWSALTAVLLYYHWCLLLGYRERWRGRRAGLWPATIALPYSRLFFREPLFTLLALMAVYALDAAANLRQGGSSSSRWRWPACCSPKGIGLLLILTLVVVALPGSIRKLFGRRLVGSRRWLPGSWRFVVLFQQFAPSPRYHYVLASAAQPDLSSIATAVPADLISPASVPGRFAVLLLAPSARTA
jgi:hypothetical protein